MKKKDENSSVHIFDTAVEIDLSTLIDLDLFDLHDRVSRTAIGIAHLSVSHFINENRAPEGFDTIILNFIELLELMKRINKEVYSRWREGYTEKEQAA